MQQEQEQSRSLLVSSLQQEVGKWEGLLQEKEGHLTAALEDGQAKAMEKTEQAIKEVLLGRGVGCPWGIKGVLGG